MNNKKLVLIVVAVVLLLLLFGFGIYHYFKKNDVDVEEIVSNAFRKQLNEPIDEATIDEIFDIDYANGTIYKGDEFII